MRNSRGPLILLAIVVVVAVVGWLATHPETAPSGVESEPSGPIRFHHTDFDLVSPDLEVTRPEVSGAGYPSFTSWAVRLTCAETEGCVGRIAVEVLYDTPAGGGRVVLSTLVDVAEGGEMNFDGLQDGVVGVKGVERVIVGVRETKPLDLPEGVDID